MITSLSQLDPNGTYSYADYLTWQFGEFVELIKGHLLRMSAPRASHQRIVFRLSGMLYRHFQGSLEGCNVYPAPFDVRFPTNPAGKSDREIYTVVQPDICVICDPTKLDERGCIGAPDWIIEIVSPATINRDRFVKRDLYEEFGVKEYWIIYPGEKLIDVYLLNEKDKYDLPTTYAYDAFDEEEKMVAPQTFSDISLSLKEIFS